MLARSRLLALLVLASSLRSERAHADASAAPSKRTSGRANEDRCSGPELVVDPNLAAPWKARLEELEAHLQVLADVDRCATVELLSAKPGLLVQVRLADGRTAVRRVAEPSGMLAAVESLVTQLPAESAPQGVVAVSTPEKAVVAPPADRPVEQASPAAKAQGKARTFSLEAGLAPSARLAMSPTYIGYGLVAEVYVMIDAWILGTWLRWDIQDLPVGQSNIPHDLAMASLLLGISFGRRFELGQVALDVAVGPNVVIENQEAFEDTPEDVGGEYGNLTLGASVRATFPRASSPRAFALFASELYPRRVGHENRVAPSLPPLPQWCATLALGIAWSAL